MPLIVIDTIERRWTDERTAAAHPPTASPITWRKINQIQSYSNLIAYTIFTYRYRGASSIADRERQHLKAANSLLGQELICLCDTTPLCFCSYSSLIVNQIETLFKTSFEWIKKIFWASWQPEPSQYPHSICDDQPARRAPVSLTTQHNSHCVLFGFNPGSLKSSCAFFWLVLLSIENRCHHKRLRF